MISVFRIQIAASGAAQIQAKLPQIHLLVFSGDAEACITWSRAFVSAIDSHKYLTSDAKLQYLITSVSGVPLRLVSESEATGTSHTTIMRQLRDQYEDRAAILSTVSDGSWNLAAQLRMALPCASYSYHKHNLNDKYEKKKIYI